LWINFQSFRSIITWYSVSFYRMWWAASLSTILVERQSERKLNVVKFVRFASSWNSYGKNVMILFRYWFISEIVLVLSLPKGNYLQFLQHIFSYNMLGFIQNILRLAVYKFHFPEACPKVAKIWQINFSNIYKCNTCIIMFRKHWFVKNRGT
jgi:hypothetical protein